MSFFSEQNDDATSIEVSAAATGPLVGFLDAFEVSYNSQVRGAAMYGIEKAFNDEAIAQTEALRKAGVENIPNLSESAVGFFGWGSFDNDYLDIAKFYQGQEINDEMRNQIASYDTRIEELRKEFPDLQLKTSREMWDGIKSTAQQYERRASTDRNTLMGTVGSFIGGMAGAFNVESDPWNVATIGVGGVGRSVGTRIAGQAGAQGLIEGVNQVLGVQEQRELLGLEHGLADAAMRVGGAAIGGAVLQGVGEGLAFGVRRWFLPDKADPAPAIDTVPVSRAEPLPDTSMVPPGAIPADEGLAAAKLIRQPDSIVDYAVARSPFGVAPASKARTVLDMDYVATRLNEWTSERPWELSPRTETALPTRPANDFTAPDFKRFVDRAGVDGLAREIDPATFRVYDQLAARKQTLKRWIDEIEATREDKVAARLQEVDSQLYALQQRAIEAGGKRVAKIRKDMDALRSTKREILEQLGDGQAPGVRRVREDLIRTDEKMRDLAPVVSRAYARAQSKWTNTAAEREAIHQMMAEGGSRLPAITEQDARVLDAVAKQLTDEAPILQQAYRVEARMKPDADAADYASAILADNAKVLDEQIDIFRASIDGLLGETSDGKLRLAGRDYEIDLDAEKIVVPNEDGEGTRTVSVRQLLEEQREAEYDLEAMTKCSI